MAGGEQQRPPVERDGGNRALTLQRAQDLARIVVAVRPYEGVLAQPLHTELALGHLEEWMSRTAVEPDHLLLHIVEAKIVGSARRRVDAHVGLAIDDGLVDIRR